MNIVIGLFVFLFIDVVALGLFFNLGKYQMKKMKEKKLNIDPKKVEYNGSSFRLIISDEDELMKKLKKKQAEIIQEIEEMKGKLPHEK